MAEDKSLSILVLSCDKYSQLWRLFFSRFKNFWPNCPYQIFLLGNKKQYEENWVRTILTGDDKDWSSNLLIALNDIPTDYVLLMIEDAPLNDYINHQEFVEIYQKFCNQNLNYLSLKADTAPNLKCDKDFIEIPTGAHYRAALVPNLWRVSLLKEILVAGETAWQFEIFGSDRSDKFMGFAALSKPFFNLLHCVIKGKLDRRVIRILKKNNELENIIFPIMGIMEYLVLRLREMRTKIFFKIIPYSYRRNIRNFYYKFLVKNGSLKIK